ncbi:MAG TPA: hypothetical protein QGI67_06840, partial [Acidimicrobiales bacterium]|nr:hypothetical protein [Acidimicrobiales bacterium]
MTMRRNGRVLITLGLVFALVASACGSDDAAPAATTAAAAAATTAAPAAAATTAAPVVTAAPPAAPVEVSTVGEHLGDGSLGTVEVGGGEAIQIRSLNAISGDVA